MLDDTAKRASGRNGCSLPLTRAGWSAAAVILAGCAPQPFPGVELTTGGHVVLEGRDLGVLVGETLCLTGEPPCTSLKDAFGTSGRPIKAPPWATWQSLGALWQADAFV